MSTDSHQHANFPPEIWGLMFSHASWSDLAHAAQASRVFLHSAVPHVWKDIRVEHLLGLLLGTLIHTPMDTTIINLSFYLLSSLKYTVY